MSEPMETIKEWLGSFEGYAPGNETKIEILRRAATAFGTQGYHGSSLRAIARSAGIDHSTLLHHFGNKEKLLTAVLEWRDLSDPPEIPDEVTAEMIVAGLTDRARRNAAEPGLTQLFSVLSAEAGIPGHPARDYLQRRHAILVALLAKAITSQRAAGKAADNGLDPEHAGALIVATWDGLQIYEALHPGEVDVAALIGKLLGEALGVRQPGQAPEK